MVDGQGHLDHLEVVVGLKDASVGDALGREDHPQRHRDAAQLLRLGPVESAKVRLREALGVVGMQLPS
ncbi:MAG: hypothetical protein M3443_19470, partial [Actinomycetota bacterium]|nr:hypothetical protein [Actinomycetota bacterium]